MGDFVHLHVHTEYSLLDGAAKIDKLVDTACKLGQPALAITDHGAMYGAVEFYKKCIAKGIKPIIGCEVYVAPKGRLNKTVNSDYNYSHLVLLAKNNTGYRNLLKIVSDSFVNGFYYKPRTDMDILSQYSEGIIALSACFAGEVQRYILNGDIETAKQKALDYKKIFGDDFYLELQDHNLEEDNVVNKGVIEISEVTGISVVATNDVHYVEKGDSFLQKVLLCIGTNRTINEDNPMAFKTEEFYLKSFDEMSENFGYIPDALSNTVSIANQCNVTFDFENLHVPKFKTPKGVDSYQYLYQKCVDGLVSRYGNKNHIDKLEYELSVISKMQFVDYFLIVSDFVNYAKRNDIAVGPGRGSATGSLVSYCLGITDIDPIKYGLIFERFLNPGRVSMPDIDIDFCVERRSEVLTYIIARYGIESVSQIIAFGTLAARAAIKDVGRVLEIPYATIDSVSKHFSSKSVTTIRSALDTDDDLQNRYDNNDDIRRLIDTAMAVEGFARHSSTHAAGVVITDGPITDFVPLAKNDDFVVTQYQKNEIDQLGLLKIDLLGLRNITVIDKTVKLIKKDEPSFDLNSIPENDIKTFDIISQGNTLGVFQLESAGMRKLLANLKPNSIDDIIAAVSLYRPGPMDSIPTFLYNRQNPSKIVYKTPLLEPILKDTFGCIVYQEQVMEIARTLAGYSYEQADILRAAMSKKKIDIMQAERKKFIDGCRLNNISKNIAQTVFDDMSEFAKYGFNKSHAAGYAVIAYRTAYLKANYPAYFMASLLSSVMYNTDKVKEYISECNKMGITVLPPDINKSRCEFVASENTIYYGLAAIKGVGKRMADVIDNQRELEGEFSDYYNFISRVSLSDVTKRAIEGMICSGVFDSFGFSRQHMMTVYDRVIQHYLVTQKNYDINQISFFDEDEPDFDFDFFSKAIPEYEDDKKLYLEKMYLGLYLSMNPLDRFAPVYKSGKYTLISDLKNKKADEKVKIFGIIDSIKAVKTKQLKNMAYVNIEDISGVVEVILFPNQYDIFKVEMEVGTLIEIEGTISKKDDDTLQIICKYAKFPNPDTVTDSYRKLYLNIPSKNSFIYEMVLKSLCTHKGENSCILHFSDTGKYVSTGDKIKVDLSVTLLDELKSLLGDKNIVIK